MRYLVRDMDTYETIGAFDSLDSACGFVEGYRAAGSDDGPRLEVVAVFGPKGGKEDADR